MLQGYVTYIAATGMALLAVVDALNGDLDAAATKLTAAMGFAGLRRAVGK